MYLHHGEDEFSKSAEEARTAARQVEYLNSSKAKDLRKIPCPKVSVEPCNPQTHRLNAYRRALQSVIQRLREPGDLSEFKKGQALAELKSLAPDLFT